MVEEDKEDGEPTSSGAQEDGEGTVLLVNQKSKYRSFRIRTLSTLVLVGGFFVIVYLGHVPLTMMVFCIQTTMVRELFALAEKAQKQQPKPPGHGKKQQWYFFVVSTFWVYFRFIHKQLTVEITSTARLAGLFGWLLRWHTILAFAMYTAGFMAFVLQLQKGCYLYQFGQYAWTHLTLMFIQIPSSFFVSNIFDGIIWFLLPCGLVIINDIGAYLAGFFFGRTPLIKLSPKKTWEGFFGGLLITSVASWLLADLFSRYKWMICPRTDLSFGHLDCVPDPLYVQDVFAISDIGHLLPAPLLEAVKWLGQLIPASVSTSFLAPILNFTFIARPMQLHAVVLAMFASIIAPFGGFFASGFKRSFKIKDFGDSIPGHGGMTDRMDCQVVMAVFAYLYFNTFLAAEEGLDVPSLVVTMAGLPPVNQLQLLDKIANLVGAQGLLPDKLLAQINVAVAAQLQRLNRSAAVV
eukprot:jgi/Botrbrau1/3319/Bobra.0048s0015.1